MNTDHPSEQELLQFAAGELDEPRFEQVATHLEDCEQCGDVLRKTGAFPKLGDGPLSLRESDVRSAERTTRLKPISEGPGSVIGPYKLLQQLGEGGMGVVYMAEQEHPVRRMVALKIIKPGMDSGQVIARFEAERQALAMMDHHHIAKVLDAGTTETGRPYFAMELVKGVPITDYCDRNKLNPRERLEMFIPVCQAIQHAHQKGIIHRDIKPSNVLVTLYDGKPVPKVIDFGIAKATQQKLTERTMFTGIGQILGTLEYMSPEQAEMNQLDIDTRSDVYSLGVMLYELLTGSTPITKAQLRNVGLEEMLRTIRETEPPKPSTRLRDSSASIPHISAVRRTDPARLSKFVHGDLDWIVMKALEKSRTRRYETASALAADIQRFLADEVVEACPPSARYRFRRFAQRNKIWLIPTASLTVMILMLAGVSLGLAAWALTERDRYYVKQHEATRFAETARRASETARRSASAAIQNLRLAERNAYAADMFLAGEALHRQNDMPRVASLLDRHRPKSGRPDLRGWEWRYLWQFCQTESRDIFANVGTAVRAMNVSPSGDLIAMAVASRDGQGELQLWNLQERTLVAKHSGLQRAYRAPSFSPDGQYVVAVLDGGVIQLLGIPGLDPKTTLESGQGFVSSVEFSPDGTLLAAGCTNGTIIWELATKQRLRTIPGRLGWKGSGELCFSPNGETLFVGDTRPGKLQAFKVSELIDLAVENPMPLFSRAAQVSAVAANGRFLAYSLEGAPYDVFVLDAETGKQVYQLQGHFEWIHDLLFDDQGYLWSAGDGHVIRVWDVQSGENRRQFRLPYQTLALCEARPGKIISGGPDGVARFWNSKQPRAYAENARQWISNSLKGRQFEVLVSPDEREIIYLDAPTIETTKVDEFSNRIMIAKTDDVRVRHALTSDDETEFYSSLLLYNQQIVATTLSGKLRTYGLHSKRPTAEIQAWEPHKDDEVSDWLGDLGAVAGAITPKSDLMVTLKPVVNSVGTIVSTDFRTFSINPWLQSDAVKSPNIDTERIHHILILDDGEIGLAVGDRQSVFWSPTTGEVLHKTAGLTAAVYLEHHDPPLVAIASLSGTVRFLRLTDFSTESSFKAVNHHLTDVAWMPKSQRFVTGSKNDQMVRLWDLETQRLLLNLPGEGHRVNLCVSPQENTIVARDTDGTINVWSAPTWEQIREFEARQ